MFFFPCINCISISILYIVIYIYIYILYTRLPPKSRPVNMQPPCQGVPKTAQNWRVALFFGNELSAMETAQRWQGAVHLLGEARVVRWPWWQVDYWTNLTVFTVPSTVTGTHFCWDGVRWWKKGMYMIVHLPATSYHCRLLHTCR